MALYLERSTQIYEIYLRHVAPEDIHVYSIDEVFIDVTGYLRTAGMTAHEFAAMLARDVFAQTGITATVGLGTNLYLAKVAMDIVAKLMAADEDGTRIAELDEMSYRHLLWDHRPLPTSGVWAARRPASSTRRGWARWETIARCSLGARDARKERRPALQPVRGECRAAHRPCLGLGPCTIADVKAYRPESSTLGSGTGAALPYPSRKRAS